MQVAKLLQGSTALQHNLQCIQHYITATIPVINQLNKLKQSTP